MNRYKQYYVKIKISFFKLGRLNKQNSLTHLINTHPHDKQTINQNYLDIRIYPLKYQSPMFFFNLFKNL